MFRFGTKAETLERLHGELAVGHIPTSWHFAVADWHRDRAGVLGYISSTFNGNVAVRSSTQLEDGLDGSHAGAFRSVLSVDTSGRDVLTSAIEEVIDSYRGNSDDQILVQTMVTEVTVSGVAMTYNLEEGSPYYVINYDDESGRTDSITGGSGVNKIVKIYRESDMTNVESPRVGLILAGIRELESICQDVPLDIEFCICRRGQLHILQVRPISLHAKWDTGLQRRVGSQLSGIEQFLHQLSSPRPDLVGNGTVLGNMPDWNPAEIIGTSPRPLAVSLYRDLVTRQIWADARAIMGYRAVHNHELMVLLGGRPYIDVRASFNSFLPADLPESIAAKLTDHWLNRLADHPELHDKVEFEVATTIHDFNFTKTFRDRYEDALSVEELSIYSSTLLELTQRAFDLGPKGSLSRAYAMLRRLERRQHERPSVDRRTDLSPMALLDESHLLLRECREDGVLPFSILARHGFIAETFWRSAVTRDAITPERVTALKLSINTVSSKLVRDLAEMSRGTMSRDTFMEHYGHLRPGTYDILSPRYADRLDLFLHGERITIPSQPPPFELDAEERRHIAALIKESKLEGLTPERLVDYTDRAVAGREWGKFVFTRNLSDVLELLARWGSSVGLTRDDLSWLSVEQLLDSRYSSMAPQSRVRLEGMAERARRDAAATNALQMPYIIRNSHDLYVVPSHRSAINFIGSAKTRGAVAFLDAQSPGNINLKGKVVLIENADPGFDWIFSRGIAGLVTKFGGANSHMAIRCAEFGLPAAIGCGEQTFERLQKNGSVELNCAERVLRGTFDG